MNELSILILVIIMGLCVTGTIVFICIEGGIPKIKEKIPKRRVKMKKKQEHLDWCKERALKHLEDGNIKNAFASMALDLGKHPETADHPGLQLGTRLLLGGHLNSPEEMRKFIEDFN